MLRIVKVDGGFSVEVETYKKVWWFFGKVEWLPYNFGYHVPGTHAVFESYHHALQQLLIDIERELNLYYLDNHEKM